MAASCTLSMEEEIKEAKEDVKEAKEGVKEAKNELKQLEQGRDYMKDPKYQSAKADLARKEVNLSGVQQILAELLKKENLLSSQGGAGPRSSSAGAKTIYIMFIIMLDEEDENDKSFKITFKSQEKLEKWLQRSGVMGLVKLPESSVLTDEDRAGGAATSSTGAAAESKQVQAELVDELEKVTDGARYLAVRSDPTTLSRISSLENHQRTLGNRREQEMERAIAAMERDEPGAESVTVVPSLRQLASPEGKSIAEFDAVVQVDLQGGGKMFVVGEHKATTKGSDDVDRFLGKVKRAEAYIAEVYPKMHPFHGNRLKLVFMTEYVSPKVEPVVRSACTSMKIARLTRGTGGIIKAQLHKPRMAAFR